MKPLDVVRLGRVGYADAYELQLEVHARRVSGGTPDTLLLLEHPHVFTVGRRGSAAEVLWDEAALAARGVEVVHTDRGGRVTYHGPGQLVGYPILHLGPGADLTAHLRRLEETMIRTLDDFAIRAGRAEGLTGVWVGTSKVGAIGVRVSRNVTTHGFALNVSPDLGYFAGIVPCGIVDRGVTSMEALVGAAPTLDAVADAFVTRFAEVFTYDRVRVRTGAAA